MAELSYDEIADYLTDGYWDAQPPNGGFQPGRNSFDVSVAGLLTYYVDPSLSVVEREYVRAAFDVWGDVTGISFIRTLSIANSDIDFTNTGTGAYAGASYTSGGGSSQYAQVNVAQSWVTTYDGSASGSPVFNIDSYAFQTYVHEIGHALGLGHAGEYNGGATFGVDNHYDNDSWQATIMSYFDQVENGFIDADYAYAITPQIADILAIQDLYGVPTDTRIGDTTYGFNSNAGGIWDSLTSLTNAVSFTIFDSAGIDTFDLSGYTSDQLISLRAGSISNVGGLTGNAMIAMNTIIENAVGGSGNDTIYGNTVKNILEGGAGNDLLVGGLARDFLFGGDGDDQLRGGRGNDVLDGGADDDVIRAGLGIDLITGGSGADVFVFRSDNDFSESSSEDTITDFEDGIDTIKLVGYASGDVNITDLGGGNYDVDVDNGHIIHVTMNGGGTLAVDDFNFA